MSFEEKAKGRKVIAGGAAYFGGHLVKLPSITDDEKAYVQEAAKSPTDLIDFVPLSRMFDKVEDDSIFEVIGSEWGGALFQQWSSEGLSEPVPIAKRLCGVYLEHHSGGEVQPSEDELIVVSESENNLVIQNKTPYPPGLISSAYQSTISITCGLDVKVRVIEPGTRFELSW